MDTDFGRFDFFLLESALEEYSLLRLYITDFFL